MGFVTISITYFFKMWYYGCNIDTPEFYYIYADGSAAGFGKHKVDEGKSVRVQIDEEGVKAAAYIEFPGAGSSQPPEEIIDFILDRPFVFAITTDSIPLFMGTVNNP